MVTNAQRSKKECYSLLERVFEIGLGALTLTCVAWSGARVQPCYYKAQVANAVKQKKVKDWKDVASK